MTWIKVSNEATGYPFSGYLAYKKVYSFDIHHF